MLDIPFAARRHHAPRSGSWARTSCSGIPVLGASSRALGGFPVARDGTDRKAVRDSMAMLRGGRPAGGVPGGHAPARPEDPAAATGRRLPRVASRACRSCPSASAGSEEILAQRQGCSRASTGSRSWSASRSCRRPHDGRPCRAPTSTRSPTQLHDELQQTLRRGRCDTARSVARGSGRRALASTAGRRRGCGRRRTGRRRARARCGSPPSTNAATASSAGSARAARAAAGSTRPRR